MNIMQLNENGAYKIVSYSRYYSYLYAKRILSEIARNLIIVQNRLQWNRTASDTYYYYFLVTNVCSLYK